MVLELQVFLGIGGTTFKNSGLDKTIKVELDKRN